MIGIGEIDLWNKLKERMEEEQANQVRAVMSSAMTEAQYRWRAGFYAALAWVFEQADDIVKAQQPQKEKDNDDAGFEEDN